jgi:hypothetical protein
VLRSRAWALIAAVLVTVAYGVLLLVAFDPGVEQHDARELVADSDDAEAFLIADLFFPLVYGGLLPLAMWRFSADRWARVAALLLVAAAPVDWLENILLLTSTDEVSENAVDAAHVASWVNVVLFTAGAVPGLVLLVRAVQAVRSPTPSTTAPTDSDSPPSGTR